jgi:hypothetical protein
MTAKTVIRFLTILLVISTTACSKEDDCFKAIGVNGEWIWVQSIGGFGGWTLTPESENKTQKLVIDDFTFQLYINDSLAFEKGYTLGKYDEPVWGTKTFIKYDSGGEQAVVIGDKELHLIDLCADCYFHKYRRN